ncbi:hypothetical protein ASQ44_04285 [Rickettsia rhipicephali]|nr:hypothetical protein ASQ44_04285 [Rickettsia rhipicephali]
MNILSLNQELAKNINNPNTLKRFNKLSPEKQIIIENFLEEAKEQAKPFLKEHFETYKIDLNILDIIPTLLNKMPKTNTLSITPISNNKKKEEIRR